MPLGDIPLRPFQMLGHPVISWSRSSVG
jgi:hypothetical protein